MRYKKILSLFIILFFCSSLLVLIPNIPKVKADNTNLAPITPTNPYTIWSFADPNHPDVNLDTTVLSPTGLDTIRIDGDYPQWTECDTYFISCQPFDRIMFSCYIKTNGIGNSGDQTGARIGIDFYTLGGTRIAGVYQPDGTQDYNPNTNQWSNDPEANYVSWSTTQWTKITMSFTVPLTYVGDGFGGVSSGQTATPNNMVLWMQLSNGALSNSECWFGDPILTINGTTTVNTANILGQSIIGDTINGASGNYAYYSSFIAQETGTISSINAYVNSYYGGTTNAVTAIFNGTISTSPLARTSTTESISASWGWVNFPITPMNIVSGNVYTLAILGDTALGIVGFTQQSGTGQINAVVDTYPTFTNPLGTSVYTDVNGVMSIYANITLTTSDTIAPTYSNIYETSTTVNTESFFYIQWQDNVALSYTIFGSNETGTFLNQTALPLAYNPDVIFEGKQLPSVVGDVVSFEWWANDTSNNWANTGKQYLTVTTTTPTATPTATPTVIPQATNNEIFGFIGELNPTAAIAFIGGIIMIALVALGTFVKHRR